MTAVARCGHALISATEELRRDREVVMTAVANWGNALEDAAEELRGDREVVMTAVAQNGNALRFAAEELRGDREVVMAAVADTGWALEHATEELRGDKEIMEIALARTSHSGYKSIGLKALLMSTCLLTNFTYLSKEKERPEQCLGRFLFFARFCSVIVCPLFLPIRAYLETVPSF